MTKKQPGVVIFHNTPPTSGPDTTVTGSVRFEQARQRLAKLAGLEVEQVQDPDVREYLNRGEIATREYLAARRP